MVNKGRINIIKPILREQIQPASLDLRIGVKAIRIRSSFLPGIGNFLTDCLRGLYMYEIDLTNSALTHDDRDD